MSRGHSVAGEKEVRGSLRLAIAWAAALVSCLGGCLSEAQIAEREQIAREFSQTYDRLAQEAERFGAVGRYYAGAPLRRFLLVRHESDLCAVRFKQAERMRDAHAPSGFSSGEETVRAEYDWYHQPDGSGDFTKQNVKDEHGKVSTGPIVGLGRLVPIATGNSVISCGTIKVRWEYPTSVTFHYGGVEGDYGIELAPTRWSELDQIKLEDPKLKWYRYDAKREHRLIPLDELP